MKPNHEEPPMLVWSEMERHFDTGLYSIFKKEYDKAIEELKEAIKDEPDNPDYYLYMGQALYYKGLLDEAMVEFDKALEINPEAYRAYYWKSIIYAKKDQMDKSKACYKKGYEQDELDLEIRYDWANEMSAIGRYAEAVEEYKRILDHEMFTDVRVKMGIALIKSMQEEAGRKEFNDAAESVPDRVETFVDIGAFYLSEGRIDDAFNELKRAYKIEPRSRLISKYLNEIYRKKGMLDEVVKIYKELVRQCPKEPEFHSILGDAYYDKGMKDEALYQYRWAKRLDPNYPLSESGKKILSSSKH